MVVMKWNLRGFSEGMNKLVVMKFSEAKPNAPQNVTHVSTLTTLINYKVDSLILETNNLHPIVGNGQA